LSRGKVSQPCLARPVRRPLPRSLCGGKEDAPDTAVLETTRGYAALSQHLAAWRGQPRARIAVAHAHALCVCHALPPGTCLRMRSPRVWRATPTLHHGSTGPTACASWISRASGTG